MGKKQSKQQQKVEPTKELPLYLFLVMSVSAAQYSNAGKIELSWADGMVGVCPVFDSREAADKYAEGKHQVIRIERVI